MNEYFKTNNYYPYEEEIISILRRLDKNDDGRLILLEMEKALKPMPLKEFKQNNFKGLYSSNIIQNEKNSSASKNLTSTIKHTRQSSITQGSNNKKLSSPVYKSSAIYKSPISKKNGEEVDPFSKVTSKYEKYDGSTGKISSISNVIPNTNELNKSPPNYYYYPYEPVRKAFSPLKEQILKSSNVEPSPKILNFGNNLEKNSQLAASSLEKFDKYSSGSRGKYNNEYGKIKSPISKNFVRNEEITKKYDSGSKNEVISYFKKIVHFEGEIERMKQDLFFRPDFNLFDLYMIFDKDKKGYCFMNDFEQAFKIMNINLSGKEALLFFKKFEKNNCGRLRMAEFSRIFCPILLEGQPQSERRSINNEGQFDYFEVKNKKKIFNFL